MLTGKECLLALSLLIVLTFCVIKLYLYHFKSAKIIKNIIFQSITTSSSSLFIGTGSKKNIDICYIKQRSIKKVAYHH